MEICEDVLNENRENGKKQSSFQPLLTCCIMVKNEVHCVEKTLLSCVGTVDNFVILDTGSTDGTQKKIIDFCNRYKIYLTMYQHPFIDFAQSKNMLISLAKNPKEDDESCLFTSSDFNGGKKYLPSKYILMLDANDELSFSNSEKRDRPLENSLRTILILGEQHNDLFILQFECMTKNPEKTYTFMRRAIFKTSKDFFYKYPVHEELLCSEHYTSYEIHSLPEDERSVPKIIHDRSENKVNPERKIRDITALENFKRNFPNDVHVLAKLGQAYYLIKDYKNAMHNFEVRSEYSNGHHIDFICDGMRPYYFQENYDPECFNSYINCLKIAIVVFKENRELIERYMDQVFYYNRAFGREKERCEPYFYAAIYYYTIGDFETSYRFINESCSFEKPLINEEVLFVDDNLYDLERWELAEYLKRRISVP